MNYILWLLVDTMILLPLENHICIVAFTPDLQSLLLQRNRLPPPQLNHRAHTIP